jgi:hypothetical protein
VRVWHRVQLWHGLRLRDRGSLLAFLQLRRLTPRPIEAGAGLRVSPGFNALTAAGTCQ